MASPHLLEAVREFTSTIVNPYDLEDLLHRLTGHATVLAHAHGAGIMLAGRNGGLLGFAAASDERVLELEAIQDRIEAGPCHEAFVHNELRVVEDLEATDRWPEYQRRAAQVGLRSVLGVPMNAWGQTIGVVNIYRERPGPWTRNDIETAEIVTAMGAGYVLHANQIQAQHDLAERLRAALESRDVIGQAKGLMMGRYGIDADEAFEQLRTASQRSNLKLRDIAQQFVEAEEASVH